MDVVLPDIVVRPAVWLKVPLFKKLPVLVISLAVVRDEPVGIVRPGVVVMTAPGAYITAYMPAV